MAHFGTKIAIDYQTKKSKKCSILYSRFEKKMGEGEVVEKMLDVIGVFNIFFVGGVGE